MAKTVLLAARGAESRTAVRSSRRAMLVVLVALGLSIVVAVGLLAFSGQLQGGGPFDSSRLVRYGLPVARAVHDLAAALTVGLLAVGTWCLAPDRQARDGELTGLRLSVIRRASIAAMSGRLGRSSDRRCWRRWGWTWCSLLRRKRSIRRVS